MSLSTSCGLPTFGRGNSKLPSSFLTFSLPAGYTCPGALHCLAMADRETGRITDGPQQQFRCHAATSETRPSVRNGRWRNYELIKHLDTDQMADALLGGLMAARELKSTHVRWFVSGDCYSAALRDAIAKVACRTGDLIHYFYTKNLPLFLEWQAPPHLRITASVGGKHDHLLKHFNRTARVVHSYEEAEELGLPIDFTDVHAWQAEPSHFCHLVHGSQPAGSRPSLAIAARRKGNLFTGYGKSHRQLSAA